MLMADTVMDADEPRFQIGEDEMDDRQIVLGNLWVAALGNGKVFIPALAEAGISTPIVSDGQRPRSNGALHEPTKRVGAPIGYYGEPDTPGIASVLSLVLRGSRFPMTNLDGTSDENLVVDTPAFAASPSTNPCLVYLNMFPRLAADTILIGPHHASAELVENAEGRLIARHAKLSLKLNRRDAGRLAGDQISRPKPCAQRHMAAFHDGANRQARIVAALATAQDTGTSGDAEGIACGMAMRTDEAVAPSSFFHVGSTLRFIGKKLLKLWKRPRKGQVVTLKDVHGSLSIIHTKSIPSGCVRQADRQAGNEAEYLAYLEKKVAAMNGDGDAMNGDGDAMNGDGDAKAPDVILADAREALKTLPDDATDEERASAMAEVKKALMLAGNEAEYLAYLEKKVADQAQAKKDADAADAAEMASDKAEQVLTALDPTLGESMAPVVELAASSSGAVTATFDGYTMSPNAPDAITGYRGAILTTDTAELHVYTNIADAVATPIAHLYRSETLQGKPAIYSVMDTTDDDDILWSQAKRTDARHIMVGTGDDAVTTFAGSVRGVAGTFSCMGNCTVPAPDDVAASEAMNWKFVPTDPNGTIDVADETYLSFGWWLNQMDEGMYETDVFANAYDAMGMAEAVTGLPADDVDGSATYKGGAAGKWAIASTTDETTAGGHFTATATLTANFDADTTPDGMDGNDKSGVSIGGSITKFMTGDVSRPKWKVTLMAPAAQTTVGPIVGADTEWATGGALKGAGTWDAKFYGEEADTMHPTAATGEFNAAIADGKVGRISGAFAATK